MFVIISLVRHFCFSTCKETKKGRNTQIVSSFFCYKRCIFSKIAYFITFNVPFLPVSLLMRSR